MQGPAVAYRALFLTGEDPCNHNARSSGSSFPHIQQRSYPLQLSPRIITGSSREKLQGGNTQSTHQTPLRVGLCGVRNFTTIPIPAVAYPNQGEIRISFPNSTSDTRVVIRKISIIFLFLCNCHLHHCSCYIACALPYPIPAHLTRY